MSHAARTTLPMPPADGEIGEAARAATDGPVVLTENGQPAFVLMTHDEYVRRDRWTESVLHAFEDPSPEADFDFDPPRLRGPSRATPIDLE